MSNICLSLQEQTDSPATAHPQMWAKPHPKAFQVGMKLEARDRKHPSLVCVASVNDINPKGWLLVHFDGWSPVYDYWCAPDSTDIHPIGWYARNHRALQPPNSKTRVSLNLVNS